MLSVGAFTAPSNLGAQQTGFSVATFSQLMELDLIAGGYQLSAVVDTFRVSGLAMASDGSLYALSYFGDDLWQIDPSTGASELIGPVGVDVHVGSGLTFDACGRLWMISDSVLYELDPDTAQASMVSDLEQERIVALTAVGDQLLAVVGVGTPSQLARIDPEEGTLELFGDLVELPTFQVGLDFDQEGSLWATYWIDGPIPGPWISSIVRYEPSTGEVLSILEVPDAQVSPVIGGNLGVSPPQGICGGSPVAIPADSPPSRLTLILLLIAAGWFAILKAK